jgi:hypothetical protein
MNNKSVLFSQHAKIKFEVLRRHGLILDENTLTTIINNPDNVFEGYLGRKIAQGHLDKRRILRIVFEEKANEILALLQKGPKVTFYRFF